MNAEAYKNNQKIYTYAVDGSCARKTQKDMQCAAPQKSVPIKEKIFSREEFEQEDYTGKWELSLSRILAAGAVSVLSIAAFFCCKTDIPAILSILLGAVCAVGILKIKL